MLEIQKTALIVLDMQEKLIRAMAEKEQLIINMQKVIKGAKILGVPILFTEQYRRGLGPTIPEIAELLTEIKPLDKMAFGCSEPLFQEGVRSLKKEQLLLCGIESHVCIYQTAADLISMGYQVEVLADCVSSRSKENKHIALDKIRGIGARITIVEMILFELLRTAESKCFKDISQIVK